MIPRHLVITAATLLVLALAMAFYVRSMRSRATYMARGALTTQPVAAPVSGPAEQVTLYVAYDDEGVLLAQAFRIPLPSGRQQRAEELLRALIGVYLDKSSPHPLPPGSDLRGIYLVDAQQTGAGSEPGLAVVDLNAAFADGHRSGVLAENLTIASLVKTLTANILGITRVKILIDGQARETLAGHADLSGLIDVAAMNQMAGELANP
jgi:hypothetical protein